MNQSTNLLAFDLGAESGRAILGQFDGNRLQLSEVHRFANTPIQLPGSLHWNILQLWAEIKHGLALAIQQHGTDLASVGIDTWGVDFGLLDQNGALLGLPVHYRDARTDGMVDEAFRRVPRNEIFAQTGIQFMQLNSLYQLLSLVVNQSPILDVAQTFLTIPDLLNYWLTGRKVCEFTNATTTQCYNPIVGDWASLMLDKLGIPSHFFPEIVQPGTILGDLQSTVSHEIGAQHLPVVTPACHDTGSAVASVPAQGSGFAWISSGTWSIMGVEVSQAVINEQALAYNMTNEGGANNTFRLCKNVMGLWIVQECLRTWARQGHEYTYPELVQLAKQADPLQSIIDVDSDEFLKPGDMPTRIRDFCQRTGQLVPETHGAIVRCTLESLALKYRVVLERLDAMIGHRLDPIHIVGGGTQNTLLSQFTADATGRQVITGPVEATAIGNLIVQAMALGYIDSLSQGRELIKRSFDTLTYEPIGEPGWDAAYGTLLAMMD